MSDDKLTTGCPHLDAMLKGGLKKGDMTVFAGRAPRFSSPDAKFTTNLEASTVGDWLDAIGKFGINVEAFTILNKAFEEGKLRKINLLIVDKDFQIDPALTTVLIQYVDFISTVKNEQGYDFSEKLIVVKRRKSGNMRKRKIYECPTMLFYLSHNAFESNSNKELVMVKSKTRTTGVAIDPSFILDIIKSADE
jgi:hypothetical protein